MIYYIAAGRFEPIRVIFSRVLIWIAITLINDEWMEPLKWCHESSD